jgi:hypothetical protein
MSTTTLARLEILTAPREHALRYTQGALLIDAQCGSRFYLFFTWFLYEPLIFF